MKIEIGRNDGSNITVMIDFGTGLKEFKYQEFISNLYENEEIEDLTFNKNITEDERNKMRQMIAEITAAVAKRDILAEFP